MLHNVANPFTDISICLAALIYSSKIYLCVVIMRTQLLFIATLTNTESKIFLSIQQKVAGHGHLPLSFPPLSSPPPKKTLSPDSWDSSQFVCCLRLGAPEAEGTLCSYTRTHKNTLTQVNTLLQLHCTLAGVTDTHHSMKDPFN